MRIKPILRKGEQVWWTIATGKDFQYPFAHLTAKTKKQAIRGFIDEGCTMKDYPSFKPVKIIVRLA